MVPVDLAHAEKATDMILAAQRVAEPDAKIWLVNAVEMVPQEPSAHAPGGLIETSRQAALSELKRLADTHAIHAGMEIRDGPAHQVILALAEEKAADCIIIASHKPGLQDYLIGSTAARVVKHAKCAVLVLR